MKRIVLIGLAPADLTDVTSQGETAFSGRTGRFLAKIAGLPDLSKFTRKNLLPRAEEFYGSAEKHAVAARRRAAFLIRYESCVLVLCGGFVAKAFGFHESITQLMKKSPFVDERGTTFYVIPHPSGRCRSWNKYETRARVGLLLRSLAC
jgi:uracil-DNA glycosylase